MPIDSLKPKAAKTAGTQPVATPGGVAGKRGRKKPTKAEGARLVYRFEDGRESLPLIEANFQRLCQAAWALCSEEPRLREKAKKMLRAAAERIATADLYHNEQRRRRAGKPGVNEGITGESDRNDRIRAAYNRAKGERGTVKRLAIDFELSERTISRIVADLRT